MGRRVRKQKRGFYDGEWHVSEEDQALFDQIAAESSSENKKHFFRVMEYREKHNQSTSGDVLLHFDKNPDGVGFMRYEYDGYLLIINTEDGIGEEPLTADTLSIFLNVDIGEHIFEKTGCRTMFEYLRSIDYAYVDYEADYEAY